MPDLPTHFPIPVNDRGEGPADDDAVAMTCWCGDLECEIEPTVPL